MNCHVSYLPAIRVERFTVKSLKSVGFLGGSSMSRGLRQWMQSGAP